MCPRPPVFRRRRRPTVNTTATTASTASTSDLPTTPPPPRSPRPLAVLALAPPIAPIDIARRETAWNVRQPPTGRADSAGKKKKAATYLLACLLALSRLPIPPRLRRERLSPPPTLIRARDTEPAATTSRRRIPRSKHKHTHTHTHHPHTSPSVTVSAVNVRPKNRISIAPPHGTQPCSWRACLHRTPARSRSRSCRSGPHRFVRLPLLLLLCTAALSCLAPCHPTFTLEPLGLVRSLVSLVSLSLPRCNSFHSPPPIPALGHVSTAAAVSLPLPKLSLSLSAPTRARSVRERERITFTRPKYRPSVLTSESQRKNNPPVYPPLWLRHPCGDSLPTPSPTPSPDPRTRRSVDSAWLDL